MNHDECVQKFSSIYQFILNRPAEFAFEAKSIQGALVEAIQKNISQDMIYQTLSDLADPNFKLPASRGLTFCQYMARPLLSPKSVNSFYAHGPRPRTTGGWKQSEEGSNQTLEEKNQVRRATDLNSQGDRILIQDLRRDLQENRLIKMERIRK